MNYLENLKSRIIRKKEDSIIMGKIENSFLRKEELTESQLNHHVHIVGASGFGKTVLLSHLVKDRIEKGKGLLFIDLKGDIDTIEKFLSYAKKSNRMGDVEIFSISEPTLSKNYNLILEGTATQLRDKIILSLVWSEEFYKNQSSSFLLKLLIGLCYLRDHRMEPLTLKTILDCTEDPEVLAKYCEKIPEENHKTKNILEQCYHFLQSNDNFKSLQGLRSQLESLVLADFGELISGSENSINLFESINSNKIVFIFLDSRRYGVTAQIIGKFILQDLKMVSSRIDAEIKKVNRKPFCVIIDEFADLAQEDFIGFLDRARSSKISIIVAHQEICDLLKISPEFAGRLMGNTATLYAFLQKRPESAELICAIAGTKKTWKETVQSQKMLYFDIPTGGKSLREVEEFCIHPNQIKMLKVGQCAVVKKYPFSQSHTAKIDFI